MVEFDWTKIRFLESASSLRKVLSETINKKVSAVTAKNISICLQQGRLFFEASQKSQMEIRPLQLFYGMMAFSKALTLGLKNVGIETLPQRHGLKDISNQNSRIENLCVKVERDGTFQNFNDQISRLNRIPYLGDQDKYQHYKIPCACSSALIDEYLTLKEIFSRIPEISELYWCTFGERAKSIRFSLRYRPSYNRYCEMLIFCEDAVTDRNSLVKIVSTLRERYPFLKQWCIENADISWSNAVLSFGNVNVEEMDEFAEENLQIYENRYYSIIDFKSEDSLDKFNFFDSLPPISGGFNEYEFSLVEPFNGHFISEFSLQYLGLYLLSSAVRYRPTTWVNSVSRYSSEGGVADDHAIALIEKFLTVIETTFPDMIVKTLNCYEDRYREMAI